VRLSPLGTAVTTGLWYQPQMIGDGDCGAIGGMKMGRWNRSTRRNRAPAPLCPPHIPHKQTRARTGGSGGKPETNRLSYGAAWHATLYIKRKTLMTGNCMHIRFIHACKCSTSENRNSPGRPHLMRGLPLCPFWSIFFFTLWTAEVGMH
jgi:hypothetical protein